MSGSPAPMNSAAAKPQTLDDLMMAMDVVDTIRYRDLLVARELGQGEQDEALRTRLRDIYRGQGIEVTDAVIDEGIKALKESRFVYTPPAPSFGRSLAYLWVARARIARWGGAALAAVLLIWGVYQFGIVGPRERAAIETRTEISETLPHNLQTAYEVVIADARVDAAKVQAATLLSDGKAALARQDATGARAAIGSLDDLHTKLLQTYELRVISRENEDTGVWRVPEVNQSARNYYLIVEAINPQERALKMPIRNEEDGKVREVTKWGQRVPQEVFDSVRADKRDDGIVQDRVLGEKLRGELEPRYRMRVLDGAITSWDD